MCLNSVLLLLYVPHFIQRNGIFNFEKTFDFLHMNTFRLSISQLTIRLNRVYQILRVDAS